jgi:hypothetical protein
MIKQVEQLLESIKQIRLASNTKDNEEFVFKQSLLSSLRTKAKSLSSSIDITSINENIFLETVKQRFNAARKAAIIIISKSDKDVGDLVALAEDKVNEKSEKVQVSYTYNQLTLEQILSLNPTNSNLQSLIRELDYLNSLLPKAFTKEDMLAIIKDNKLTNIKDVMNYFKATYPNQYDNKLLASVAKSL